jgi:hypothetical protein
MTDGRSDDRDEQRQGGAWGRSIWREGRMGEGADEEREKCQRRRGRNWEPSPLVQWRRPSIGYGGEDGQGGEIFEVRRPLDMEG